MASRSASQPDTFAETKKPACYEVHYAPPNYPDKCFPSRCKHEGPFAMFAELHLRPNKKGAGRQIEIDHAVCFNCGLMQDSTYGGNVLLALTLINQIQGHKHWKFSLRAQQLRQKWGKIATYLFDENGWNEHHERIARLIDRNLTMKLSLEHIGGNTQMGTVKYDWEYLRPEDDQ